MEFYPDQHDMDLNPVCFLHQQIVCYQSHTASARCCKVSLDFLVFGSNRIFIAYLTLNMHVF